MGVTVRNNGQAPVRVFEPAFPVQGVEAQIQEVQTGRVFNVVLTFPQGFELPAGQRTELSLKTSHPRYPEVKVPAQQAPKPTAQPPVSPVAAAAPKAPLETVPSSVYFNLLPEGQSNTSRVVRIVNTRETPVTLSAPESSNPLFGAELKTVQAGKEFELVVTTLKPLGPGATQGRITIKTSSPEVPVVNLPVVAMVQQLIAAIPSQLMLPPSPAASGARVGITIRNNSQGPITVTDPAIDLEGLQPQVQALQPGRIFRVMVNLPPGFELPAGRKGELSVKTSHPQYPTIKVPVLQMPKPAQAPFGPSRAAGPWPIQPGTLTNTLVPRASAPAPSPQPPPASTLQK
jgi:hypothetical protein